MTNYFIESTTRKYDKGYGFLSFARNLSSKYGKSLRYCYKSRGRCCKNCSKKVVHKTGEATEELIGNKVLEKIMK